MARLLLLALFLCSSLSASGFVPIPHRRDTHRTTLSAVAAGGKNKALIIQNKGGGHGELGFQLAKVLKEEKGLEVLMVHDGGPEPRSGEPFDSYDEAGLDVVWTNLGSSGAVQEAVAGRGPFEFVIDNWSKDTDMAKPVADLSKEWNVENYIFVSSAGMYKGASQPMKETDEVKETGQRAVEELLAAEGLPWTSFRPQYIYGPKTNKRDYIDWFFDRVVRDLPLPIPNGGDQLVSLTNSVDVAKLLAAAVGNAAAVGEAFNCATDDAVSYDDLAAKVAAVCGKDGGAQCEHYAPADFDVPKGFFPFRDTEFYVDTSKARSVLGWSPACRLDEDLEWYYQDYLRLGLDKRAIDFTVDEQILVAPDPLAGLFPTKYDELPGSKRNAGMLLETFDELGSEPVDAATGQIEFGQIE